jgi:hypothetical protein
MDVYGILEGNPVEKGPTGRRRSRSEGNIKMGLKEVI